MADYTDTLNELKILNIVFIISFLLKIFQKHIHIIKKNFFYKVKKQLKTKKYVYIIWFQKKKVHKIVILHLKNIFK